MLDIRRIGDQHQARHSRLENRRVAVFQVQHHAFADSADFGNRLPFQPLAKDRHDGLTDRLRAAAHQFDAFDSRPHHAGDAAAHCFDFGKLRHDLIVAVASGRRDPPSRGGWKPPLLRCYHGGMNAATREKATQNVPDAAGRFGGVRRTICSRNAHAGLDELAAEYEKAKADPGVSGGAR